MILATQHKLGEYQVTQTLGLVYGNTVRSRNIVSNTVAGWRTLIGGEVKGLYLERGEQSFFPSLQTWAACAQLA